MPTIVYVDPSGVRRPVEAAAGASAMRAAFVHGVDGIAAECGGAAMCATCHVYVEPDHVALLEPMDEIEDEMLDSTATERTACSRLSCQIRMTDRLDGLVLHVPAEQV